MDPINLSINILGGALTGYVTNDVAVNMIFRRFGPFGGIIIKTKERFITNISKLVEREIINGQTLGRQINRTDFKESLTLIVEAFLKQFQEELLDCKQEDIPGYRETQLAWEQVWSGFSQRLTLGVNKALGETTIADLMTERQRQVLISQTGQLVRQWLKVHRHELESMVNETIDQVSGQLEKYLKDSLFANPARQLGVVDTLLDLLGEEQLQKFDDWFSRQSLADIVAQFDQNVGVNLVKHLPKPYDWITTLRITQGIQKYIVNRAFVLIAREQDALLKGRVEKVVATNLSRLSEAQLQQVVADFMGRELKPISVFGAGLGALAALLLAVGGVQTNLIWGTFVFGLIGYLTNVIALKMVFRPYKPIFLLGKQLPFTPGVVAKQQQRFARSMAKFVGEHLIDRETISKVLTGSNWDWQKSIKGYFATHRGAQVPKILTQVLCKQVTPELLVPHIPQALDALVSKLYAVLLQQRGSLKSRVWQQLEAKGGWSLIMANRFLSIDNKIYQAVDLILDTKLPNFWQASGPELYNGLATILKEQAVLTQVCQQSVPDLANKYFSPIITELLDELATKPWVDPATSEFINHKVNTSLSYAVTANLPQLMKMVDIKWVTEREVGSMPPESIEKLFYSFAGLYLRRLEFYGWLGGIVGLVVNVMIQFVNRL